MTLDLKALIEKIPKKSFVYLLGLAGLFLILITSSPKDGKEAVAIENEFDYCNEIENRLEKILPDIASVGKVSVMVTAKNQGRITLAKDKDGEREEFVIINKKGGGEEGVTLEESYPAIQGVIIVAEGGRNNTVKAQLTEAVSALLGVDAHRVKIFERKVK